MSSSCVPGPAAAVPRRAELAAVAGMIGAVLFVSVFTVQGWLDPGYSWTGMFVSELALGPHGWVQIFNFVLTGALVLAFGRGLAAHFSAGAASRAGPVLVQGIGASLMASGPFTTDPSAMSGQASAPGVVHGIFGALVFTFAPLSCFVFYRRFRSDPLWRPLAGWTLAAGVVLTLGVVLLKISQQPGSGLFEWKGLIQRVLLAAFMAWIFAVASRLRHRCRVPTKINDQTPRSPADPLVAIAESLGSSPPIPLGPDVLLPHVPPRNDGPDDDDQRAAE